MQKARWTHPSFGSTVFGVKMAKSFEEHLEQILILLKDEEIERIIMFGSAATEQVRIDSDLDLLIVLDTDFLPTTYQERMEYRLRIQRKVRDVAKRIPVDLLIYTRPEYELLTQNMNSFMREIHDFGRVVYEKAS